MKNRTIDAILIDAKDNVATTIRTLQGGETVLVKTSSGNIIVTITTDIPPSHKFATRDIKTGEHVMKFGEVIGEATDNIELGAHVHTQNVKSLHGRIPEGSCQ